MSVHPVMPQTLRASFVEAHPNVRLLVLTALAIVLAGVFLLPVAAELATSADGGGRTRTALYIAGLVATIAVVLIATRAARRALNAELEEV